MAPALTEPLSPTEKLSNSTATATPSTRANNRKVDGATTTTTLSFTGTSNNNNNTNNNNNISATNTVNVINNNNTNNNNNNQHTSSHSSGQSKRNRNSTHPTTSARITRSKDKERGDVVVIVEQRVEKSGGGGVVAPSNALAEVASSANQKSNNKSIHTNEQMGLSAALNNNNNNNKNNNTTNKCNNETSAQYVTNLKDTSTEQLLADLTDNFEETITAEICLRKKLHDVELHKVSEESSSILNAKDNVKDVVYQIEVDASSDDVGGVKAKLGALHMDANIAVRSANLVQVKDVDNNEKIKSKTVTTSTPPPHTRAAHVVHAMDVDTTTTTSATAQCTTAKLAAERQTMPPTCALAELPLINTDSTITASEVDDNLEERLSQLDGTAVTSCAQELHNDMSPAAESALCSSLVPATPPRTPTQQQMHQQQLQQLQAQLQHTPPQQQHQQQQQNSLTPQSTTSSSYLMKEGNSCGGASGGSTVAGAAGTGGEIEDQELEEVLKVLKGFDGSGGPDALCDLNVFFNEVYTTLNEEMSGGSQQTTTATAAAATTTTTAPKSSPLKDLHADIEKKQLSLQRRIDFMLRRLRKLQARYMCRHASEEVSGLFELSARLTINKSGAGAVDAAPAPAYTNTNLNDEASSTAPPIISGRPPAITWQELRKTPVSSAQVSSMLRKLESAANAQQLHTGPPHASAAGNNLHLHLKKSKKAAAQEALAAAAAAAAASAAKDTATIVVPHFDSNISEELTYVAGLLQTEMREVQTAMDSDATESSSGAESADEIVTYNNPIQQSLSIAKRAAWRYLRDRAAIASRWSWLLSQIADLEIKIRQHSELMQEIVRSKGPLLCATDPATGLAKPHPSAAETLELMPTAVNSYMGTDISGNVAEDANASAGCCRTRSYLAPQFRKRKLLQTTNIHTISKKAARPSTIKCGCQWPLLPCALCTGRVDPTAPRDLPDTMMMPDRIALLDPGYHPVLSFPEDVSNAIHFEAIARLPDWQQRVMRCQVKSIAKGVWKAEREAAAAAGHATTTKRRYIKKKDRLAEEKNAAAAAASTAIATTTTATTNSGSSSTTISTTAMGHTAGSSSSGGAVEALNIIGGGGNGGLGSSGGNGGNGIGTLSTSTTPLVANRLTKNAKKSLHCIQLGDAMQEPKSPGEMHYGHSQHSHNYVHQTGDYPPPPPAAAPQNYDPYNPSQAHSSLISSGKNNKHRKYGYYNHHQHHQQQHNNNNIIHYNNYNNNSSYYTNNSNGGDMSFLCATDNWDSSTRSRTSSPTHLSSSSNYKYERSLDRKNRTSYDIDNIVIPYSVAAATRVEILPYKEIPTPKWRVIGDETSTVDSGMPPNEITSDVDTKIKSESCEKNTETVASNKMPINGIKEADAKCAIGEIKTDVEMADASLEESKDSSAEKLRDKSQPLKAVNVAEVSSHKVLEQDVIAIEKVNKDSKMIKMDNENAAEPAAKKIKTEQTETEIPKSPIKAEYTENGKTIKAEVSTAIEEMYSDDDEEDGVEDISDDAMTSRHERALTEERRKFQTFLKFPWSTRSRANRRIDSRAESSGANTPDPTSPAPQTPSVGGGDQESIPSPLAPSTPLNPLDTTETGEASTATATLSVAKLNNSSKRYERRRTTSAKKEREIERRSSTPDPREFIAPYESLKFPLSDELYESLLRSMPTDFQEYSKIENYPNATSIRTNRIRGNVRGSDHHTNTRRSSKSTAMSLLLSGGSARKTHRRGSGKGVRLKSNSITGENGKIQMLEELERTSSLTTGDDDEDDDVTMPEFIADDDDDDDYPKHHLAPNDNDDDELLRGANTSCHSSTAHGTFGPQVDEYEAYVGAGRNILGDSDADSSATEPFQDDDPNDPEWKGESEDRSERLRKKL